MSKRTFRAAVICFGLVRIVATAEDIQVNTYTMNDQESPSVAASAASDFVVVWASEGSAGTDSSLSSIQGQRYSSDGSPVGEELQVNTYTTGLQWSPSVAASASDDFFVGWTSFGSAGTDSSNFSVHGQHYGSGGSPIGGELQINTYTTSTQWSPSVAAGTDGEFPVVWESSGSTGKDSSGSSVQRRPSGGVLIFVDGFESGDTSAWSAAGLP